MRHIFVILLLAKAVYGAGGLYGTDKAHADFMSKTRGAVQYVADQCDNRSLEELTNTLSKLRFQIAKKHTPDIAKNFLILRDQEEALGHSTPLIAFEYTWLRGAIRDFLPRLIPSDEWTQEGCSRFRLRIMSRKSWPSSRALSEATHQKMRQNPPHLDAIDLDMVSGFDYYHFDAFLKRGCFRLLDERMKTSHVVDPQYLDTRLLQKIYTPRKDVKVFYFDTEHLVNGVFLPGFRYIGAYEDSIDKALVMLIHPPKCYVKAYFEETTRAWDRVRAWNGENVTELYTLMGTFHYYWGITMKLKRGSAALGGWLSQGLYNKFQNDFELDKAIAPSVDNLIHSSPTLTRFLNKYILPTA
jgi:hypothetical protein